MLRDIELAKSAEVLGGQAAQKLPLSQLLAHSSNILQGGLTLPIRILAMVTEAIGRQLLGTGKYVDAFQMLKPWSTPGQVVSTSTSEPQDFLQL